MSSNLLRNVWKKPIPDPPGFIEPGAVPTAVVQGSASVPIEIHLEGISEQIPSGSDIVFLIDNSGSMNVNDQNNLRFKAIQKLIQAFQPTRDNLDRISLILFQGKSASVKQRQKKWSDTLSTLESLPLANYLTPMADGMNEANKILMNSDAFYKIVILLSDGEPTDDNFTNTPIEKILGTPPVQLEQSLIYQAWQHRILYSTIYLFDTTDPDAPNDSSLLIEIARRTDYITDYSSQTENPAFYFRINDNLNEIVDAYRRLLDECFARAVPMDFEMCEIISEYLIIDKDFEVSLTGNGLNIQQNLLGFGSELDNLGIDTLEAALEYFKDNGKVTFRLNELFGELCLRFSVKLNLARLQGVDENQFPGDRICIDVDVIDAIISKGSYIRYFKPVQGPSGEVVEIPMPQARVCFKKGIYANKVYSQEDSQEYATISIVNYDLVPKEEVELMEIPSAFINTTIVEDDFKFKPFALLLANRLLPWYVSKVIQHSGHIDSFNNLPRLIQNKIRDEIGKKIHKPCRVISENDLDRDLSKFVSFENPPQSFATDRAWKTDGQRGYYRLVKKFPKLHSKKLKLKIDRASYLISQSSNPYLNLFIDAITPKEPPSGIPFTKSKYATKEEGSNYISQNPNFSQVLTDISHPDISISNCFMESDLNNLKNLFLGYQLPKEFWDYLNSIDITTNWDVSNNKFGADIRVHNFGIKECVAQLHVKTIYMPFTGKELTVDLSNRSFSFKESHLFMGVGNANNIQLPGRTTKILNVNFSRLLYLHNHRQVGSRFLNNVKNAIVITTATLDFASDEIMTGNNSAIDICRLYSY